MALYSNIALKATQGDAPYLYLGVINDGSERQCYLDYSTDQVLTKNAKFAVEYAYGDLVHIRSSLTNKYWVRSSSNGFGIVARGVEPVVDTTSWTCTLFRMNVDDDNKTTFYHVQSDRTVCLNKSSSSLKTSLTIDPAIQTEAASSIVDYDTLVVLPKFVALKGSNGLYYKNPSRCENSQKLTTGFLVSDIGDPDIVCEMQNTCDGTFRVKAGNSDKYWTYFTQYECKNLITGDSADDNPKILNQIFAASRLNKNIIALRSLANQKFCARTDFGEGFIFTPTGNSSRQSQYTSAFGGTILNAFVDKVLRCIRIEKDQLAARAVGLVSDTYLEVVEPVINRTVNVYEFDLDNARIYNVSVLYSHEHVWDNYTDEKQSGSANGSISTTKSRTYRNSITASGNVTTTFEAGVPLIGKSSIEVSASVSYSHGWDHTEEETQSVGHTFNVIVKPMKRTIARGVATKGSCDVPFAYVQKDYPTDGGPPRLTKLQDGVFSGSNAYNFHDEVRYEDLPLQVSTKVPT